MGDGDEQQADVALVEAGDGVAEIDRDAAGEASGEAQDPPLAAGAGKLACVQGGDRRVPVDGGHLRGPVADAGAALDEAAGEVVAVQERAVADEQFDGGFVGEDAAGTGSEGTGEQVSACR